LNQASEIIAITEGSVAVSLYHCAPTWSEIRDCQKLKTNQRGASLHRTERMTPLRSA